MWLNFIIIGYQGLALDSDYIRILDEPEGCGG